MNNTELIKIEEIHLINNTVYVKINSLIEAFNEYDHKETDTIYIILKEAMILEICKYLEEYDKRFIPYLKNDKKLWLHKIHSPLYERIKKDQYIRKFRNQHIAHSHRDYEGKFKLAMETFVDYNVDIGHYELILLGKLVIALIMANGQRLQDTLRSGLEKLDYILQQPKYDSFFNSNPKYQSMEDVNNEFKLIIKECDDNFEERFPTKEIWLKTFYEGDQE